MKTFIVFVILVVLGVFLYKHFPKNPKEYFSKYFNKSQEVTSEVAVVPESTNTNIDKCVFNGTDSQIITTKHPLNLKAQISNNISYTLETSDVADYGITLKSGDINILMCTGCQFAKMSTCAENLNECKRRKFSLNAAQFTEYNLVTNNDLVGVIGIYNDRDVLITKDNKVALTEEDTKVISNILTCTVLNN